jgi:hypothetical protein
MTTDSPGHSTREVVKQLQDFQSQLLDKSSNYTKLVAGLGVWRLFCLLGRH